jgi:anti-anti-sigma regulatory factor
MEAMMSMLNVEEFGDVTIVECERRIVQAEAAHRLRNAVTAQAESRMIVLDLSEVEAIEGGGLGMLAYLQLWAFGHDIRLKLFNPSKRVLARIERACLHDWQIATLDELTALMRVADEHYTIAA